MKRSILVIFIAISLLASAAVIASPDTTPQQTITQLRAQLRAKTNRISDLKDQIDAQDATISDQNDTITRLRARDPLDAVTARSPDGLWAAANAIWQQFPTLPLGSFCGYDKASTPPADAGLTVTSITFYRWSGC